MESDREGSWETDGLVLPDKTFYKTHIAIK